ncbi:MAG TPA: hypothetical protein VKU84_11710, partial [Stellaceae bacterium]|nr:hypothetical protein [Stellaceae bacterium]
AQPAAAAMGPIAAAAVAMAAAPQPVVAGTSALAMAHAQPQPQAAAPQPLPQAQPAVAKPLPQPPVTVPPAPVAAAPAVPEAETIERAVVREDAFIPPKPVEPPVKPATAAAQTASPDPFAAAAMANGGRGQPAYKVRAPSLFERVTGVGRGRSTPAAEPVTAGPATPAPPPAPQPQQARLGPLDPADRVTGTKGEEDLLEIPAFLRRQAN